MEEGIGINVDLPWYGSWVEKGVHGKFNYEYNELWRAFLKDKPNKEEIIKFGRQLGEKYGFETVF